MHGGWPHQEPDRAQASPARTSIGAARSARLASSQLAPPHSLSSLQRASRRRIAAKLL